MALRGHADAAGFKQWRNDYGRQVREGEKAFPILAPIKRSFNKEDEHGVTQRISYIVGWKDVKVFGVGQTDVVDQAKADRHEAKAAESQATIEEFAVVKLLQRWGYTVQANGNLIYAGCYSPDLDVIQLAVENQATAYHEAVHLADDHLGNMTVRYGQQPDNEIVAELGGAIILAALGLEHDADLGGCWRYISGYAKGDTLQAAAKLLNRTLEAVVVILAGIADPSMDCPW